MMLSKDTPCPNAETQDGRNRERSEQSLYYGAQASYVRPGPVELGQKTSQVKVLCSYQRIFRGTRRYGYSAFEPSIA